MSSKKPWLWLIRFSQNTKNLTRLRPQLKLGKILDMRNLLLNAKFCCMKKNVLFSAALFICALASFGQSVKDLTQKGMELYEKREFMEAILNLNKAIETDP